MIAGLCLSGCDRAPSPGGKSEPSALSRVLQSLGGVFRRPASGQERTVRELVQLLEHRRPARAVLGDPIPDVTELDAWEQEAAVRLCKVLCLAEKARQSGAEPEKLFALAAARVCGENSPAAAQMSAQLTASYSTAQACSLLDAAEAGICQGRLPVVQRGNLAGQRLAVARITSRLRLMEAGGYEDLANLRLATAFGGDIPGSVAAGQPAAVAASPVRRPVPAPTPPPAVAQERAQVPARPEATPAAAATPATPAYQILTGTLGAPVRLNEQYTVTIFSIDVGGIDIETVDFVNQRLINYSVPINSTGSYTMSTSKEPVKRRFRVPRNGIEMPGFERKVIHLLEKAYLIDELAGIDTFRLLVVPPKPLEVRRVSGNR